MVYASRAQAGFQPVGSNSAIRLLGWVGKRLSTSDKYANGSNPFILADHRSTAPAPANGRKKRLIPRIIIHPDHGLPKG